MSALELAAEIAADLRNRERRFALGYTDHDLTRPQIAAYYRRQAREWRKMAEQHRADTDQSYRWQIHDFQTRGQEATRCERSARECDRRAKEYEK